jgi:hypothetical protein
MKSIPIKLLFSLYIIFLFSCSVETESHIIETPVLELDATGPMFQGPNTATVTWEYKLEELFPESDNEIVIESARISTIKMRPVENIEYPDLGKVVMEMKPRNNSMSRVGLLEENFDTSKPNSLTVADVQEDFDEAFKDEKLTFVADFDMKEEEFFDDLKFELIVTFEIQTRK